jgi:hypothetical protein
MEFLLLCNLDGGVEAERGGVQVARTWRVRRKKRSGWKHPLDLNRNRRRCEKRRRSASARARRAIEAIREFEVQLELTEWQLQYQGASRQGPFGSELKLGRGLEPRGAW